MIARLHRSVNWWLPLGWLLSGVSLVADTLISKTTFTWDSSSYTVPAGANYVVVKAWGAGGNGGQWSRGDGGGGGFVCAAYLVTPGQQIQTIVGARGGNQTGGGGASAAWMANGFQVIAGGGGEGGSNGDYNQGGAGGPGGGNGGWGGAGGEGGGPMNLSTGGEYGFNGGAGSGSGGRGGTGYFGGRGGEQSDDEGSNGSGGGGGSNYIDTAHGFFFGDFYAGSSAEPAGRDDPDYPGNDIGWGAGDGHYYYAGSGAVVILAYQGAVPEITSSNQVVGAPGSSFSYTIHANGSPTSFGASGLPSWLSFNPSTRTLSGSTSQIGTYVVTVTATNSFGTGSRAVSFLVRQPQTITFGALPAKTFGDPPFALSASATSGLPVSFSLSSGPATVSGSTLTLTGAGPVTVVARQAGDSVYGAAPEVVQSFAVAKATQTIAFPAIGQKVDGVAPFTISATSSSLLPVTFAVLSGPASINGNVMTITGPGVVTVSATQAGDHRFLSAYVWQSFDVVASAGGRALEVQAGSGGVFSGTPGQQVWITAEERGQTFSGWVIVSGDGRIGNVASPVTTFTLGSLPTVVRATFSSGAPVRHITWNEVSTPFTLTAAGGGSYFLLNFAAVVTNSGTLPWSNAVYFDVLNSSNQVIGNASGDGSGGTAVGGKRVLVINAILPNISVNHWVTLRARDFVSAPPFITDIGPTTVRVIYLAPANASAPTVGGIDASGAVGVSFSRTVSSSDVNSWVVMGTLPPGITFSANGQLTGTPTQPGEYGVTFVGSNSYGTHARGGFFHIYPNGSYPLAVTGGTIGSGPGTSTSLSIGATAPVTANALAAGQVFTGWEVLSGPGKIANWRSAATSVSLEQPGATSVRANIVSGNLVAVEKGWPSPLGGAAGAAITIVAEPDANGTMFERWVSAGPGAIANPSLPTTTFTIGGGPASVTASFVPGFRLNVGSGGAGAAGGLPAQRISIWPANWFGSGYSFEGFHLTGPGYLDGDRGTMIMGAGPATVNAGWWPVGTPLTRTLLWAPDYTYVRNKNEQFNLRVATDYSGTVETHEIAYSIDGGVTWITAMRKAPDTGSAGSAYRWQTEFTKYGGFPHPGLVLFRAKAEAGPGMMNPVCFYSAVLISDVDAAAFVTQPISLEVQAGQDARFSFSAISDGGALGSVMYKWQKGGADIPGKSGLVASNVTEKLELTGVTAADAGAYTVAIKIGAGATWLTSSVAHLTVTTARPTIVVQPASTTAVAGNSVTFSVLAVGPPPLTYQWRKGGIAISGATTSVYAISNVQAAHQDSHYTVAVSNPGGTVISNAASLSVSADGPSITTQPASLSAMVGTSVSLGVAAWGAPPLTYQWYKDGSLVTGATLPTLSCAPLKVADGADYFVIVSNPAGSVTSAMARITVVIPDPYGHADSDGILNGVEAAIGTNPQAATAVDSTNQAQLLIHKP